MADKGEKLALAQRRKQAVTASNTRRAKAGKVKVTLAPVKGSDDTLTKS